MQGVGLHILKSLGVTSRMTQKFKGSILHLFGAKVHIVKMQVVEMNIFKM